MSIVPFIIAAVLFATQPVATSKKAPQLTDSERRRLAGVIATIEMVESRLYQEMALGHPEYNAHIAKALDLIKIAPFVLDEPQCPPGTCEDDSMCIPCYPPLCKLITLNGRIRMFKTNLMKASKAEPLFRTNEKKVFAMTQDL